MLRAVSRGVCKSGAADICRRLGAYLLFGFTLFWEVGVGYRRVKGVGSSWVGEDGLLGLASGLSFTALEAGWVLWEALAVVPALVAGAFVVFDLGSPGFVLRHDELVNAAAGIRAVDLKAIPRRFAVEAWRWVVLSCGIVGCGDHLLDQSVGGRYWELATINEQALPQTAIFDPAGVFARDWEIEAAEILLRDDGTGQFALRAHHLYAGRDTLIEYRDERRYLIAGDSVVLCTSAAGQPPPEVDDSPLCLRGTITALQIALPMLTLRDGRTARERYVFDRYR